MTLLVFSSRVLALAFEPTETEWLAWPDYCKARYVVSGAGVDSRFSGRITKSTTDAWEYQLGADVWYSLHHYCAALLIANRAKLEADPREREKLLRRAASEFQFSLARLPKSHPIFSEAAARQGMIYEQLGEPDLAIQHFDLSIEHCPQCFVGYQSKAMSLRRQHKFTEAHSVLEKAEAVIGTDSVELNYMFALVLLDMKNFEAARARARRAYDLGYPLPGLRSLLDRAGYPLD